MAIGNVNNTPFSCRLAQIPPTPLGPSPGVLDTAGGCVREWGRQLRVRLKGLPEQWGMTPLRVLKGRERPLQLR
jgi:hypothetical protein